MYMCVRMYICISVYICGYVNMYLYVYMCVCICMNLRIRVYTHVYVEKLITTIQEEGMIYQQVNTIAFRFY